MDKPPLLLDRNERSFRLGILMHRLSLLHPSSPPPPPPFLFLSFRPRPAFSIPTRRLSRDFFAGFRLAFPFLSYPDKGAGSLLFLSQQLALPSSSSSSFRKLLPTRGREIAGNPSLRPTSSNHFKSNPPPLRV